MLNPHRFAGRRPFGCGLCALAFVLPVAFWPATARAQTINPTTVSFLPSPDNDSVNSSGQPLVTSYNLEIYQVGASQPYTVLDLGKPPVGSDGYITVNFRNLLSSLPLPGQTLDGRVAAVGPGGTAGSSWSNTFMFDNPPAVQLTSPASGATFGAPASISLAANAADSDGTISRVDFYANNTLVGSVAASPYAVTWSNVSAGSYALSAVATDNAGLKTESASVSITVTATSTTPPPSSSSDAPPTVTVTSPTNGATFAVGTASTIAASATDTDGTISRVDFYVNGNLLASDSAGPYSVGWTPTAAGNYTITAVATDNAGLQTTSAPVSVKVRRKGRPGLSTSTSSTLASARPRR